VHNDQVDRTRAPSMEGSRPIGMPFRAGILAWAVIVVTAVTAFGVAALGDAAGTASPRTGRYIVVLSNDVEDPVRAANRQARRYGGHVGFVYTTALKGYSATFPRRAVGRLIVRETNVSYVTADRKGCLDCKVAG
jgi:hypothetical protein